MNFGGESSLFGGTVFVWKDGVVFPYCFFQKDGGWFLGVVRWFVPSSSLFGDAKTPGTPHQGIGLLGLCIGDLVKKQRFAVLLCFLVLRTSGDFFNKRSFLRGLLGNIYWFCFFWCFFYFRPFLGAF